MELQKEGASLYPYFEGLPRPHQPPKSSRYKLDKKLDEADGLLRVNGNHSLKIVSHFCEQIARHLLLLDQNNYKHRILLLLHLTYPDMFKI
jgi:hypothetical protein